MKNPLSQEVVRINHKHAMRMSQTSSQGGEDSSRNIFKMLAANGEEGIKNVSNNRQAEGGGIEE